MFFYSLLNKLSKDDVGCCEVTYHYMTQRYLSVKGVT